jgi:hypothetical protein
MTKSQAQRRRLSANYIGSEVPNEIAHPLIIERLKAKTIPNERGCWVWQAFRNKGGKGYGYATYKGKNEHAHRAMYRATRGNGVIPEGWDVCHTCDDPACINPLHLFAAPRAVNVEDMRAKHRGNNQKKTQCPRGHEYTPDNTYICKRGWRGCLKCQMIRNRLRSGWTLLEAETLPLVPQGAITARRDFKHRLRNSQSGKT